LLMLYLKFFTPIAWTWYVLIGSLTTLLVAWLASFIFTTKSVERAEI